MSEIEDLLKKKKVLIHDIYINTKNQTIYLEKDHDTGLEKLVEEREKLIAEAVELDKQIKSIGISDTEYVQLKNEIENELKQIIAIDKENSKFIQRLQQEINNKIKLMNRTKNAINNGYYNDDIQNSQGYFLDKKK